MAMAMSAAEAHAAAASEGLELLRAENATGFWNVGLKKRASKPFQAKLMRDGRTNFLGFFATAEEAALTVARFLGPEGVAAALAPPAPAPAPMTEAEALAAAEAEGLTLLRSENPTNSRNPTGFKYVSRNPTALKPFQARPIRDGHVHELGRFATAEEAALAVARFFGPQ